MLTKSALGDACILGINRFVEKIKKAHAEVELFSRERVLELEEAVVEMTKEQQSHDY